MNGQGSCDTKLPAQDQNTEKIMARTASRIGYFLGVAAIAAGIGSEGAAAYVAGVGHERTRIGHQMLAVAAAPREASLAQARIDSGEQAYKAAVGFGLSGVAAGFAGINALPGARRAGRRDPA